MESRGQKVDVWKQEWEKLSPETEIEMWDYFGLRQWILKYTPRNGKVLEAGCGLGRYNFYLSHFGIETIGLDFSVNTIDFLKKWQKTHNYNLEFIKGDVKKLPFERNSLGGYLSFGVIEHFIEGPQEPIREALRVLAPGGIAIISTPSPSWSKLYFRMLGKLKKIAKRILGYKIYKSPFFQYEYSPNILKKYVESAGFYISKHSGADWLFTFTEFGKNTDRFIKKGSLGYSLSHWFEKSIIRFLGAQSIVIAIKSAEIMHCFLCGDKTATMESLNKYDVPICKACQIDKNSSYYEKGSSTSYHNKYIINPPINKVEKRVCMYCNCIYKKHILFEDFGFDKNVCPTCLRNKNINILLSNTSLQPIWRKRRN